MRRRHRKSDCPIHFALEVFGDPWSLLIIRDLMFKGGTTYTDFLHAEEGIATNVLADRLVRLEQDGIVAKGPRAGVGGSHYKLTPKGVDLLPTMLEIIGWSARYDPRTAAERGFVRRLHTDKIALAAELRSKLTTGHGRPRHSPPRTRLPRRLGPQRARRRENPRERKSEVPR